MLDLLVPCYYVLTTAEASSNLARYAGLLYGYRSPNAADLNSTFTHSRSEGFGTEVKRRIMLGTFVLSSNHYDAYYTKAQKVRNLIKIKTNELFAKYDFILTPTTSTPAFELGEKSKDPIAMYLADLFTVHANIVGIPAISVPTAVAKNKMPFGMQLMAPMFKDNELIHAAQNLYSIANDLN
jgi:aspartyl-tRNA(Asn)/glutamyl-tRNA(Gln) amidotransferase subunit A